MTALLNRVIVNLRRLWQNDL